MNIENGTRTDPIKLIHGCTYQVHSEEHGVRRFVADVRSPRTDTLIAFLDEDGQLLEAEAVLAYQSLSDPEWRSLKSLSSASALYEMPDQALVFFNNPDRDQDQTRDIPKVAIFSARYEAEDRSHRPLFRASIGDRKAAGFFHRGSIRFIDSVSGVNAQGRYETVATGRIELDEKQSPRLRLQLGDDVLWCRCTSALPRAVVDLLSRDLSEFAQDRPVIPINLKKPKRTPIKRLQSP